MSPYREQVTNKIGAQENQNLVAKAAQQCLQGRRTRLEGMVQRDMSFNSILRSVPRLVSFILVATFDTIGFPANIKLWASWTKKVVVYVMLRSVLSHLNQLPCRSRLG